jgi:uroporphyrinogen-III synthase
MKALLFKQSDQRYCLFDVQFIAPIIRIPSDKSLRPRGNYSAVICCSGESVQSVVDDEDLKHIPWFCVGNQTAIKAKDAKVEDVRGFQEVVNAKGLALKIVEWFTKEENRFPVLFPASNIRRDDLIEVLKDSKVPVVEWTAYSTIPDPDLQVKLQEICNRFRFDWMVFFSPSGIDAVLGTDIGKDWIYNRKCKLAAIGNTTADALRNQGLSVDAVAKAPNPDELWKAIKQSEENEKDGLNFA